MGQQVFVEWPTILTVLAGGLILTTKFHPSSWCPVKTERFWVILAAVVSYLSIHPLHCNPCFSHVGEVEPEVSIFSQEHGWLIDAAKQPPKARPSGWRGRGSRLSGVRVVWGEQTSLSIQSHLLFVYPCRTVQMTLWRVKSSTYFVELCFYLSIQFSGLWLVTWLVHVTRAVRFMLCTMSQSTKTIGLVYTNNIKCLNASGHAFYLMF